MSNSGAGSNTDEVLERWRRRALLLAGPMKFGAELVNEASETIRLAFGPDWLAKEALPRDTGDACAASRPRRKPRDPRRTSNNGHPLLLEVHAKQMNETEANRLRTFLQTPGAPGPAAARRRDEICCSAAHTDRAPGSPALEAAPTRHRRTSGCRRQTSSGSLHCESAARVYCRQPAAQATPRH
jgi:hypothetical protein